MAITDHPNYNQINAFKNSMIGMIDGLQQAYFVTHGKYFQGILTPTLETGLLNGTEEKQMAHGLHPSDQASSWHDFSPAQFKDGTKFPIHVRVDTVSTPQGLGYRIIFELWYAGLDPDPYGHIGDNWTFIHNETPETNSGCIWEEWHITQVDLMISNSDRKKSG